LVKEELVKKMVGQTWTTKEIDVQGMIHQGIVGIETVDQELDSIGTLNGQIRNMLGHLFVGERRHCQSLHIAY
jgi:hypothetical protein